MKKITLLFEHTPFVDKKTYEGIRMGLGLTISNDDVTLIFTKKSANVLRKPLKERTELPDVKKALDMFVEMKKDIFVLKDKYTEKIPYAYPVKMIKKSELLKILKESHIVIEC